MIRKLLRKFGWLLGFGTSNGEDDKALKEIDGIQGSRPLAEDTQFLKVRSTNKTVQRKIEACTDVLNARIKAEEEHQGT